MQEAKSKWPLIFDGLTDKQILMASVELLEKYSHTLKTLNGWDESLYVSYWAEKIKQILENHKWN